MSELYPTYCKHGQPVYAKFCAGCSADREAAQHRRYDAYWAKHRPNVKDCFRFECDSEDLPAVCDTIT